MSRKSEVIESKYKQESLYEVRNLVLRAISDCSLDGKEDSISGEYKGSVARKCRRIVSWNHNYSIEVKNLINSRLFLLDKIRQALREKFPEKIAGVTENSKGVRE